MKSRMLVALLVSALACVSTASTAANDKPDCKNFRDRVVLMVDYEYCVHAASGSALTDSEDLGTALANSVYVAKLSSIPDGQVKLKARAKQLLDAGPADKVAVVSKSKPDWASPPGGPQQHFGGGGFKGAVVTLCLTGKIIPGHYEITKTALENSLLRGPGLDFVASASRDADEFEWDKPQAHAQTGNNSKLEPNSTTSAVKDFHDWISLNATRVRSACPSKPAEAGYVLGYLFHAVEDLSSHQGITNAFHSYRAHINDNPDAHIGHIDRAKRWSKQMLDALKLKLDPTCLSKISALPADTKRPASAATFYGPKDATLEALWKYRGLGPKFEAAEKPDKNLRVSWFADDQAAEDFFQTHVLGAIAAIK